MTDHWHTAAERLVADNLRLQNTLNERNKYCKWLEEENHRLRVIKVFPVIDKSLEDRIEMKYEDKCNRCGQRKAEAPYSLCPQCLIVLKIESLNYETQETAKKLREFKSVYEGVWGSDKGERA